MQDNAMRHAYRNHHCADVSDVHFYLVAPIFRLARAPFA